MNEELKAPFERSARPARLISALRSFGVVFAGALGGQRTLSWLIAKARQPFGSLPRMFRYHDEHPHQ
jgi:hypothetical protein